MYLIYTKVFGFSVIALFNWMLPWDVLKIKTIFVGPSRKWFESVASKFIIPMAIAIFNPHVGDTIIVIGKSIVKRRIRNNKKVSKFWRNF